MNPRTLAIILVTGILATAAVAVIPILYADQRADKTETVVQRSCLVPSGREDHLTKEERQNCIDLLDRLLEAARGERNRREAQDLRERIREARDGARSAPQDPFSAPVLPSGPQTGPGPQGGAQGGPAPQEPTGRPRPRRPRPRPRPQPQPQPSPSPSPAPAPQPDPEPHPDPTPDPPPNSNGDPPDIPPGQDPLQPVLDEVCKINPLGVRVCIKLPR